MKYNMKYNSEVQYTSNKKNKGEVFLYSYASLCSMILRPSQNETFLCLHHTLVSYLGTRTHEETLISSYVVEEVSSILSL